MLYNVQIASTPSQRSLIIFRGTFSIKYNSCPFKLTKFPRPSARCFDLVLFARLFHKRVCSVLTVVLYLLSWLTPPFKQELRLQILIMGLPLYREPAALPPRPTLEFAQAQNDHSANAIAASRLLWPGTGLEGGRQRSMPNSREFISTEDVIANLRSDITAVRCLTRQLQGSATWLTEQQEETVLLYKKQSALAVIEGRILGIYQDTLTQEGRSHISGLCIELRRVRADMEHAAERSRVLGIPVNGSEEGID
jgi:hypothetical protein